MGAQRFRERMGPEEILAIDPKAFFAAFTARKRESELAADGVAVVHIEGPLEHKGSWCWDSYEGIIARVCEAAEDEDARCVVLKFDSPGGDVDGLNETVAELVRIKERTGKPFYAYANELAASAAYALACSCDEIYLPEAAGVGSIGVISVLCEQTARDKKEGYAIEIIASGERKADGNPHAPISPGARKRVEKRIDTLASMFFELVAGARGLTPAKVEGYQADVFYGADAVKMRLADGVSSWPDFLALISDPARALDKSPVSGSISKTQPSVQSVGKGKAAMGLLALRKAKTDSLAALGAAKTEAAMRRAGSEFRAACRALADAEALAEAKKMKKTKYVEETLEEDEDDADADEKDEDADSDAESDGDDGDDKDEDEDEDEDEDDGEDGKKAAAGIMRELARATGKKSKPAILGIVHAALADRKRVGQLSAEVRTMKVDAMIAAGRKAGKIEKGLVAFCSEMGMRSPAQLSEYLKAKSPSVRTSEDPPMIPAEFAGVGGGLTSEMAEIAKRMGMTPDEAAKAATKVAAKTNGVARR